MAATPQNRNNDHIANGSSGPKATFTTIRYGNNHGSISFGHIAKLGDVTCDVLIQASEGTHNISMDKDGPRKGFTEIKAPSNFQVNCGRDNDKKAETCLIHSENGNITLRASNGKIIFEALDVEFNVKGKDKEEGNFIVSASESVEFKDCQTFQVNATTKWRLASPNIAEMVANGQLKIVSSVIRGVTAGCSLKDGKFGGKAIFDKETQK